MKMELFDGNNKIISVVITVYNIEKYLRKCIESVLSSTYKNIEIILVDDGSPDGCPDICDEYALIDKRIKVIHQINQGSVIARYNGVKACTGQYISIIDGDDWVSPDFYEKMVEMISDEFIDIIFCGYTEYSNGIISVKCNSIESGLYEGDKLKDFKSRSLNDGIFYNPGVYPALWGKIFRKGLLYDIQPNVPSMIKMGDDAAITYSAVASSRKVLVCNDINGYYYRIRQESLSRSFDSRYFERATILYDYLYDFFYNQDEKDMIEDLQYYNLFLFKLGVDKVLLDNKNGLLNKFKIIRTGLETMHVDSNFISSNKNSFKRSDYIHLKNMTNGRFMLYCLKLYAYKHKECLKRFFKQRND